MTRRHLRNIERTDARRVRKVTFHMSADLINWKQAFAAVAKAIADTNRRDYVWPDAVETPTSGTETGQGGHEGGERGPEDVMGCDGARAEERESIAKWLDQRAELHNEALGGKAPRWHSEVYAAELRGRVVAYRSAAFQIRDGAHHKGADS